MPYSLSDYKGVQIVTPEPVGDGGQALNENFRRLAGLWPLFTARVLWSAAMPADVLIVPDSRQIKGISVEVEEAFDGAGAALQIGTPLVPDAFFAVGDSNLSQASIEYEKTFNAPGPVTVRVSLNPGVMPSQGGILLAVTTAPVP